MNLGDAQEPREGMQQDFHELAAFFTSAKTNGLQGVRDGVVDYSYKYLNDEQETDVQAGVPFLPELLPEEGKPRGSFGSVGHAPREYSGCTCRGQSRLGFDVWPVHGGSC